MSAAIEASGLQCQLPGMEEYPLSCLADIKPALAATTERTACPICAGGADSGSSDIEEPLTPGRTERSTGAAAQQVAPCPLSYTLQCIIVHSDLHSL